MDIPGTIYLQIEHDGEPSDPCDWTHCADQVHDSDIEYTRVQAAASLLLAALEAVGWVDGPETAPGMGGMMEQVCPWCDKVGTSEDGWKHNPGCIRQAAIAAAKPGEGPGE